MTFLLAVNGLFDFDFTFFLQALLFAFLSFIVQYFFLSPLSKQLEYRSYSIFFSEKKAMFIIGSTEKSLFAYSRTLVNHAKELLRQKKVSFSYVQKKFDFQLNESKLENERIVFVGTKGLLLQQAYLYSSTLPVINEITKKYFLRKIQY